MDALRPGHAHRSSSDRLLNNYLDSQKNLSTSLLTLLSHSHSSTSSLLAYVTSSPGVVQPVRRSVRHSAFEGPLSPSLVENPEFGHHGDEDGQGWSAYISSLDEFRKDLKQIHLLEEEMSRVKRDREILVTRLIKTTKSRPKKSDLSAIASTYRADSQVNSSRASMSSFNSNTSSASKEGKRAGKLADAQSELLGCEEHLRGLEIRIEHERNKVMMRGLEDRFRAMDAVGRMWVSQAKRGLSDLEKVHELPPDAYELDSNPSLAPSQSASQMGYEDSPHRGHVPFPKMGASLHGPGSITGSIVEEEEGSSDDEGGRNVVVHENRPGSRATMTRAMSPNGNQPPKPSPLGVPSVNSRARPLSSTFSGRQQNADDSDSDAPNPRAGGRRAASDIGALPYRPPTGRTPLRRTYSADRNDRNNRAGSDTSSLRQGKKKKGFFASISRLFKGPKGRANSGRESPPYGSGSKGGWSTRTDSNIKRSSSAFGNRRRGGDDSSSDEEGGNFVSVSNNRQAGTFSVDNNHNRSSSRASGIKRSSTMPVASGLIPQKPAPMHRNESQSTVTGRATPRPGTATPTPKNTGTLSRSNTVKSSMSTASAKTAGTAKSGGTTKKTRANGSISRSASLSSKAAEPRTIMSLVDSKPSEPAMPDVPKAPKSHVNPQMELPTAPGSSLVPPAQVHLAKMDTLQTNTDVKPKALSRSGSVKRVAKEDEPKQPPRSTTPLPPSRLLSPPLKSALRAPSPAPPGPASDTSLPSLGQAIGDHPPSKPMFNISAPGPVDLQQDEPAPIAIPAAAPKKEQPQTQPQPPANNKRNSYHSMTSDGASIYESAVEEEGGQPRGDESSGSEDDDFDNFKFVDNERIKRLGINVGPPTIERIPSDQRGDYGSDGEGSQTSQDTATHPSAPHPPAPRSDAGASSVSRRKSVRMAVPDSPIDTPKAPRPVTDQSERVTSYQSPAADRAPSPEPARVQEDWSTRIGRMRDDTSDESDHDDGYLAARKGLIRNSGKWETANGADGKKVKRRSGALGSVRSNKSSTKGSAKGGRV